MATTKIPVSIDVEIGDLATQLGKIPGITKTAAKAMVSELVKANKEAVKAVTKAVEETEKATSKANTEAVKGFGELADAAGLPVDQIKKLGEGFQALTSEAAPGVIAMGAFGAGVGAMGIVAVAAAASAAALVAGIVALTNASADALPDLAALAKVSGVELFSKADADAVRTAAAGIDAVGASASAAGVALSADLAPYVIEASTQIVALNLAFKDFIETNTKLVDWIVVFGQAIVESMLVPLQATGIVLAGFLGQAAKMVALFDKDLGKKLNDVAVGIGEWAIAGPVAGTINALKDATAGYRDEAEGLIGGQKKLNAEVKDAIEPAKEYAEGLWDAYKAAIAAEGSIADLTKILKTNREENALATSSPYWAKPETISTLQGFSSAIKAAGVDTDALKNLQIDLALAMSRGTITEQQSTVVLGELADATYAASEAAKDAAKAKLGTDITSGISALSGGLEGIATLIGGPVAGAIAGLIMNLGDTLSGLTGQLLSLPEILAGAPGLIADFVETLLTDVVPALLEALPDIVTGLVEAIPTIIDAVIDAVPLIIAGVVEATPNIIEALIMGLPDIIVSLVSLLPELVKGLFEALKTELGYAWDWITGEGISELVHSFLQGIKDGVKDLFGLSGAADAVNKAKSEADTRAASYGDTPGVVTAGSQGLSASFAPRDKVVAAQDWGALLGQVLSGMPGTAAPAMAAPSPTYLNWQDGHRSFDGFFVRHANLGGRSTQFLNRKTGRG